ncbi:hypothetical protein MMC25_005212 [Agyrium rufum]|nr:hypothetical protein [Agyrium rufum]
MKLLGDPTAQQKHLHSRIQYLHHAAEYLTNVHLEQRKEQEKAKTEQALRKDTFNVSAHASVPGSLKEESILPPRLSNKPLTVPARTPPPPPQDFSSSTASALPLTTPLSLSPLSPFPPPPPPSFLKSFTNSTTPHLAPHPSLANHLTQTVTSISRKTQIRLTKDVKHSLCKRCGTFLMPGETMTVEIENRSRSWSQVWGRGRGRGRGRKSLEGRGGEGKEGGKGKEGGGKDGMGEREGRDGKKPWADVRVEGCMVCGAVRRVPVGARRQKRRAMRVDRTENGNGDGGNGDGGNGDGGNGDGGNGDADEDGRIGKEDRRKKEKGKSNVGKMKGTQGMGNRKKEIGKVGKRGKLVQEQG